MKKISIFLFLTFFVQVLYAQQATPGKLTAQEIFKKSEAAYAALNTYLDSGKIIREHTNSSRPGPSKSSLLFKTAYSKQLGFNFEFWDPNKSNSLYMVNKQDSVVRTWWGVKNKTESKPSLSLGLAGATGISSGVAILVPRLLFPKELKNANFFQGLKVEITGSEKINNRTCFVLTGTRRSEKVVIWVDKADFLIRKVVTDRVIDPGATRAKTDSITKAYLEKLQSSLATETDSIRRAKFSAELKKTEDLKKSMQRIESASAQIRDGKPLEPFSSKVTIYYYPYQQKNVNKQVFSFRPNREVNL